MSLIPLTVYDNLRRVCCSVFPSSSTCDHSGIAERFLEHASLADVIRWRRVSSTFKRIADKRLARYTQIHVRVHDGLTKLYVKAANSGAEYKGADDLNWHPSACLLLCEMSPTSLGIVMDSKPNWKDIRTMLSLLEIFRTSVEQVFMDSPVVEMLLKEVNNKNINALLYFFSQNRKMDNMECTMHDYSIAPIYKQQFPGGPLFPNLKHFTVTSNAQQLSHLSRFIQYAVGVDLIYQKQDIDLVCLQVVHGESWCRSKQRMFRHVNSFKQWSDASSLGVKYVQQFSSGDKKRVKMSKY